jgi:cell division inhibitor SulA
MQCIAQKSSKLRVAFEQVSTMAPHCDTMDGPVVKAARNALETGNVNFILPWLHEEDEEELKAAFNTALAARDGGNIPPVTKVVDMWFFETAVRLHRKGENAPYTGLKPLGLDEGPIIPLAERALETGNADELIQLLSDAVKEELLQRFERAVAWQGYDVNDIRAGRQYVQAMLEFVFYSHQLCEFVKGCKLGKKSDEKKYVEESRRSEIIKKAGRLGHHHTETAV